MIIGIDLGTTNSLCAYYDSESEGKRISAKIIPNRLGNALTPSVVSVDEQGTVLVGETAKEYALMHPERSASVFKRFMGTGKKYSLGGHEYNAEELSAFVLRALKEDAEAYLGENVTEAVISVPAYFDDRRRKAAKRAGELAGLKVERIISEPTAAAIAYGLYEKKKNTRFLVFDLGGGTFDVSIIEMFENILEVRAVAGDNYLGGEDFTDILAEEFLDKNKISADSLSLKEMGRLHKAAEAAKRGFSDKNVARMEFSYQDEKKELCVSLKEYETLCESLFEKIRTPIRRSLSDAHIKLADIDEIVLVGGATKLPAVHNFIVKLFRKFPDMSVNPDEAVAAGAAIAAAMKERDESLKEVILTDVCPFTLGTEVCVECADGTYEAGHFMPIIDRNTTIPVSRTERVYTLHDNQECIRINVLQGESRLAQNNLFLGSMKVIMPVSGTPTAGASRETVDITYTYDINSLLEVEAKVLSTGEVKKQIIKGGSTDMSEDEIRQRMEELSYLKEHPRDQEENRLLLLKGERLYEESAKDARAKIDRWIRKFEEALSSRDSASIEEARREFRERIKAVE